MQGDNSFKNTGTYTQAGECMYVSNFTYKRQSKIIEKYFPDSAMLIGANVILATRK